MNVSNINFDNGNPIDSLCYGRCLYLPCHDNVIGSLIVRSIEDLEDWRTNFLLRWGDCDLREWTKGKWKPCEGNPYNKLCSEVAVFIQQTKCY